MALTKNSLLIQESSDRKICLAIYPHGSHCEHMNIHSNEGKKAAATAYNMHLLRRIRCLADENDNIMAIC